MAEYIKEESNILVINGVPFSLVREIEIKHNNVCQICDLSYICDVDNDRYRLIDLCFQKDTQAEWFFKIDWEVINKHIRDYIDLGYPISEDKL